MGAFEDTKTYYAHFTGYDGSYAMEFAEWSNLDDDKKVATLFLRFYDTIKMAYNNVKTPISDECECVSIVNQYLIKNVPRILSEPSRYSGAYIYTVAYNSMAAITFKLRGRDKMQAREKSCYIYKDNKEYSVFEFLGIDDDLDDIIMYKKFRKIIDSLNPAEMCVVEHLTHGRKLCPSAKRDYDRIISKLRSLFKEFEIYL